jgi:hypothetical protein
VGLCGNVQSAFHELSHAILTIPLDSDHGAAPGSNSSAHEEESLLLDKDLSHDNEGGAHMYGSLPRGGNANGNSVNSSFAESLSRSELVNGHRLANASPPTQYGRRTFPR